MHVKVDNVDIPNQAQYHMVELPWRLEPRGPESGVPTARRIFTPTVLARPTVAHLVVILQRSSNIVQFQRRSERRTTDSTPCSATQGFHRHQRSHIHVRHRPQTRTSPVFRHRSSPKCSLELSVAVWMLNLRLSIFSIIFLVAA